MKFSYTWLQTYFKNKLPKPEKLAELLTLKSFEVNSLQKISNPNDYILDIDILPNRMPDCSGHLAIGREISAILKYPINDNGYKFSVNNKIRTKDYLKIKIEDLKLCPRYMALYIKNIKVKESPGWLKNRLLSIGQKPINNIVDATNFVMLEIGQPLHAFDLEKIEEQQIIVRRAENNEKINTLDDKQINLNSEILIIADKKSPLAIAGIKGGKKAEITENTKNIIVEAAVFDSSNIRNTYKNINLKTDASLRFEHGISLYLPEIALKRVAGLIQQIAGGEVAFKHEDISIKIAKTPFISLTSEDVFNTLGEKINIRNIIEILKNLNFAVSGDKNLKIIPPVERTDIKIKEDIIEEIARIYGYEKIEAKMPEEILIPPETNTVNFSMDMARNIFTGLGFSEIYNYSFSKKGKEELRIKNAISADRAYLRENILDGLKEKLLINLKYFDIVKIFEIGKVFNTKSNNNILEELRISAAIGYKKEKLEKESFYEIKGIIETFLNKMGITDIFYKESQAYLSEIYSNNILVGFIEKDGFEINFEKIIELAQEDHEYKPVSRYPAITRDLAIFVPFETKADSVLDVIENTAGQLLIDTDLFDIYENEERKSLAFHLIFQSQEKTLTDEEVNKIINKIIKSLEENSQWEVRK